MSDLWYNRGNENVPRVLITPGTLANGVASMSPDYTTNIPIRNSSIVFLVDKIDSDLVVYKWYLIRNGYAFRQIVNPLTGKYCKRLIHVEVLERKLGRLMNKGEYVDHINGNKLDNRRSNLRLATKAENCRNAKRRIDNHSGYKGVRWLERNKKWAARIIVNKKQIHLGLYDDVLDAYRAYCDAATLYFGEFARFE